eukprot:1058103-Prymnesium_polylepis.1
MSSSWISRISLALALALSTVGVPRASAARRIQLACARRREWVIASMPACRNSRCGVSNASNISCDSGM